MKLWKIVEIIHINNFLDLQIAVEKKTKVH